MIVARWLQRLPQDVGGRSHASAQRRRLRNLATITDPHRRTLVPPMLPTGVRHCCQWNAEDAPVSQFTPCQMAFHCKSDATCNSARETLCQSLIF